jgi:hypothetical protein
MPKPILNQIACPHCFSASQPAELLFVAGHRDLLDDPVLGPEAARRFRPTRFTLDGQAVDPLGTPTGQLACPRCRLELVRASVEIVPCPVSVAGAPASGKSYFLGAMASELRTLTARQGLAFADAEPGLNRQLHDYEETVFRAADPDRPVEIRKTELAGDALYRTALLDGAAQLLPRPFQFLVGPGAGHPAAVRGPAAWRLLTLYDNAGEHFLPGSESLAGSATRHLALSRGIVFLYDPTQEPRLRRRLGLADALAGANRQELILHEIAARVRRHRSLSQHERHARPLVVALSKADLWGRVVGWDGTAEPLTAEGRIDQARLAAVSQACRALLTEAVPEIVSAAEGFSDEVLFVPISSLGCAPDRIERDGRIAQVVRPGQVRPAWVCVPALWLLAREIPELGLAAAGTAA